MRTRYLLKSTYPYDMPRITAIKSGVTRMLKIRAKHHLLALCAASILQLVVFALPAAIAAQEEATNYEHVATISNTASIATKTPESILVGQRRFVVTEATEVWDGPQRKIHLKDLPVPCRAVIHYAAVKTWDPHVLKIEIKSILPGASTKWSASSPE